MPEMVGNFVGVYSGKTFNPVEVKFDMIGRYLGEFSLSYKPTRHGKAGVGATKGSAHSSLKWLFYQFIFQIFIHSERLSNKKFLFEHVKSNYYQI